MSNTKENDTMKKRILYIDNAPMIALVIQRILGEKYKILFASSVQEARQISNTQTISLVIAEPYIDEEGVLNFLNQKGGGTSILILTGSLPKLGYFYSQLRVKYTTLEKPFNTKGFIKIVEELTS
ncbi:hypothetical protein KKG38_01745 [Patescibacteria group bacterium]|nr:hypothetical protein [Patescibacteria group bacterium]MBU1900750.1 hypothetical protein [Patescibacteria group bacterium]